MPKKILIVEDEKPIARAFELKLVNGGFEAEIAGDGAEALRLLKKKKFDLVFLDLVMPKMTGFQVLEKLRSAGDPTPIIVTSSLRQEKDIAYVKTFGVKDYFIKSDVAVANIVEYAKKFLGDAPPPTPPAV